MTIMIALFFGAPATVRAYIATSPDVATSTATSTAGRAAKTNTLNQGLVGYWTMDGKDTRWTSASAGTMIDRSGNGNTGTLVGLGKATSTVAGKVGQSLNLIGTPRMSYISTSLSMPQTNDSVSFWINLNNSSAVTWGQVLMWSSRSTTAHWLLTEKNGQLVSFNYNRVNAGDIGDGVNYASLGSIGTKKWVFVTVVHNGTSERAYFNGVAGTAVSFSSTGGGNGAFRISDAWWVGATQRSLDGKIDDVRIYNRALSAGEVKQLYKQSAGTYTAVSPTEATSTATSTAGRAAKTNTLNQGLVGYWTMDGKDTRWTSASAGTMIDRSGNGNTGTLVGLGRATSTVAGKVGQGIRFDGKSSHRINTGADPMLRNSSLSICSWIYPRLAISNRDTIISNGDADAYSTNNYIFGISNLGRLTLFGRTPANQLYSNDNAYTFNKWNFVCFSANGSQATFYSNGNFMGTVSVTLGTDNNDGSFINTSRSMGGGTFNYPFNGSIDDVRIYNRALTATEIKQLYKQSAGTYTATSPEVATSTATSTAGRAAKTNTLNQGLVGYWTMDGKDTRWTSASAGTMIDRSGNGNTGTLVGLGRATSTVVGKVGQAMKFDGVKAAVSGSKLSSITGSNSYSISAWIKTSSSTGTQVVFKSSQGDGERVTLSLKPGNISFTVKTGGSYLTDASTPYNLRDGWVNVVAVKSGNTLSIYKNGQKGTGTTPGSFGYLDYNNVVIGGNIGLPSEYFSGLIDDVRVYNRALSASEIKQLYNQGR